MKPIPPEIVASGPENTQWSGGSVDRSTMTLRVACDSEEIAAISKLLGHASGTPKRWRLTAPDSDGADLDAQVQWILSRLTTDLGVWRRLTADYSVDLFCGLFLERPNRGVSLSPETMKLLADRGIQLGFDIYAPE